MNEHKFNWKELYLQLRSGDCINRENIIEKCLKGQSVIKTSPFQFEKELFDRHQKVLEEYSVYVKKRKNGRGRVMFKTKSHAIFYLMQISPTKLIDGCWLKNTANIKNENVVQNILQEIFMDECGMSLQNGKLVTDLSKNHVKVFENMLCSLYPKIEFSIAKLWINHPFLQDDILFKTGCIQLSLAEKTEKYLPELIGYNIAYEQLPLHMLITSFELAELGIDPLYFDLHITVDNLSNGHAKKSIDCMYAFLENKLHPDILFARIMDGYNLCENSSMDGFEICRNYDIKSIVDNILREKSVVSHAIHDTIQLEGKSIGDHMRDTISLTQILVRYGYFHGKQFADTKMKSIIDWGGKMYGVFDTVEVQMMKDFFDTIDSDMGDSSPTKIKDETMQRICAIFANVVEKHKNIIVTHPVKNKDISICELYKEDIDLFFDVINTPEMKTRIEKSFEHGRMKNVVLNPDDKNCIFGWLEKK